MAKCPFASQREEPGPAKVDGGSSSQKCPYLQAQGGTSEPASWANATPDDFKQHFTAAYDAMSAAPQADVDKAHVAAVLVGYLGYSPAELAVIGDDVQLMQGTGNPHTLANLSEGEFVVDLGSGFGIDAFLASSKVGDRGRVVGVDLSLNELAAALKRTQTRGLRNVDFRLGDIEAPPIADGVVDCVISNGGFCLVPRKQVAFEQIFRILRPGGRMSISCTTRKKDLDASKDWPSCMLVFMPLSTVRATLEGIGFTDVCIDDSNSSMTVWDEVKQAKNVDDTGAKITIHKGEERYSFLKGMDMNEFFARVNIFARKPSAIPSTS